MTAYAGAHKWTPEEFEEKENALAAPSPAMVSLIQSQLEGEYQLVSKLFKNANEKFIYSTATVNSILAWLNFPAKLRHFLDCLMVLSELEAKPFTATNLDIGKQMRVGKGAKDESVQKFISRQKAKMLEWQNELGFDLVGIERGRFDALKQKNDPTTYTPFILEWIPEILGGANFREWNKGHMFRLREIRRRVNDYLTKKPECGPLRGYQPKTLSEGQKFDRTDKMLDSMLVQQLMRLQNEDIDPSVYIKYRKNRENHIITNPVGMVGNILTPEQDVPANLKSVWHMVHTGDIVDELEANEERLEEKLNRLESLDYDHLSYAVEIVKAERRDVKTPRVWDKGWQETVNNFTEESPTGHFSDSASDNLKESEIRAAKSFEINDHDGTFFDNSDSVTEADSSEGQIISLSEKTACNSLKTNNRRRDISTVENEVVEGTISDDDFTDWFADAAGVDSPPPVTPESLQALFEAWFLKVKTLMPDKTAQELWKGAWQVYLDLEFETANQNAARHSLEAVREMLLDGNAALEDFRTAFARWVTSGATYYQNGTSVPQSAAKLATFAARLEQQLLFDDG